jgi:hypothetical protein
VSAAQEKVVLRLGKLEVLMALVALADLARDGLQLAESVVVSDAGGSMVGLAARQLLARRSELSDCLSLLQAAGDEP